MAKKFSELRDNMTPESRARSDELFRKEKEILEDRARTNDQIRQATAEEAMEKILEVWSREFNRVEYDREKGIVFARLDRYTSFWASMVKKDRKIVIEIEQY
jgi:hypothetical protein